MSDGLLDNLVEAMDAARSRCSYADVRRVVRAEERVVTRNGEVDRIDSSESDGIGVRVRAGAGWAFASTSETGRTGVLAALQRALALAAAQPRTVAASLAPQPPAEGTWESACDRDPFAVPLDRKLELLLAADAAMRGDPRIVRTTADCVATRTTKAFASTEGAACTQSVTECGAGISAIAVDEAELQVRSFPGSHDGGLTAAGWEHVEALDLVGRSPRVAEEAVALLTAPPCPEGSATIVLHGEQMALQIHESIGHALELDRILGGEASYAGTSWVMPGDLGSLRYGSDALNITADATLPGGLGSYGWDDEGVAGQRLGLIEAGTLRTALSSRDSAAAVGLDGSGGCSRAAGHTRQPIVRMTNVSIEPGAAGTLEDLIADTGEGLYLETNRSWSIDDRRLHFQFATELAREISGGELGQLYRNPSYAGITPRFWGSLDAVCSAAEWTLWGVANCGKGEPGQLMRVSHGAAPARFRDVQVGVA